MILRRGGGRIRGSGGSGRWRRGTCGGGIPHGSCLERSELVSRIDGENHAQLAVASLATVDPDRVGIGHLKLRLLERSGIVCRYGDAERKESDWRKETRKEKENVQARVEATGSRRTGISEGGLCCRVILLLEDEADDVTRVGILVVDG